MDSFGVPPAVPAAGHFPLDEPNGTVRGMPLRMRSLIVLAALAWCVSVAAAANVSFDENGVCQIDGKKTFVISFGMPPPAGGKTPQGNDAFAELREAGATFVRIAPQKWPTEEKQGSPEAMARIQRWLDVAAAHDMHCWITLGELPALKPKNKDGEQTLRTIVNRFRDHPGLGGWKGADEPAWVKVPPDNCVAAYRIFKALDPDHPVILIQAPTKASLPLEPYADACDVTGVDIYPIAYPPGKHSDFGNRELSIVSDCTRWVVRASKGKPVWMTLQIAWGGVASEGKTLRFPSFEQSRYMAYAAIINGARGINYQGGALPTTLNERDMKLGWNWTFWENVMRRLVLELGDKGPLKDALLAPNSKLGVKLAKPADVEFAVREVGRDVFILAAKREGETGQVKFTGLPAATDERVEVLFEAPRTVKVTGGGFEDWFGPNDVHVYRLHRAD
jgi:hypothetical protein